MTEERGHMLAEQLSGCAESDDYREAVGLLRCFRGVDTAMAMTVLAELGDVTRFGSAAEVAAFVGLVPSEYRPYGCLATSRTGVGSCSECNIGAEPDRNMERVGGKSPPIHPPPLRSCHLRTTTAGWRSRSSDDRRSCS